MLPRIAAAAKAMKEKLTDYKQDQLPGGKYWDPDDNTKKILKSLKPHNDVCESLLGLNDWLTTCSSLVNAKQHTKSVLIETKRNKTMQWLDSVDKDKIIDLAVSERHAVQKRNRKQQEEVERKRIAKLQIDIEKAKQKQIRAKAAVEALEKTPVVRSEEELD